MQEIGVCWFKLILVDKRTYLDMLFREGDECIKWNKGTHKTYVYLPNYSILILFKHTKYFNSSSIQTITTRCVKNHDP